MYINIYDCFVVEVNFVVEKRHCGCVPKFAPTHAINGKYIKKKENHLNMSMRNVKIIKVERLLLVFTHGLLDSVLPINSETRHSYIVNVAHSGGVSSAKVSKRQVY